MPRVPSYDNFQTGISQEPNVRASAVTSQANLAQAPQGPSAQQIAAEQAAQGGRALSSAGGEVGKIALDVLDAANQTRVESAAEQLDKVKVGRQVQALSLTGRAALERPDKKSLIDEESEAISKAANDIAQGLGNDAQRQKFQKYATAVGSSYRERIAQHVGQQQTAFETETQTSKLNTAVTKAGLLAADANEVEDSRIKVGQVVDWQIKKMGLDPSKDGEMITDIRTKAMSQLHSAVLTGLLKPNSTGMALTDQAQAYYKANSAEMTLQARANAQDALNQAATSDKAQTIGAQLAAKFNYTQTADAQKEIDKMDMAPNVKVAVRAELEHRHAIQQADADKSQAVGVSKVMEMVYSGVSPNTIMRDPIYQGLRDKAAVLKGIQDYQYTQTLRANANDARALTQLQRHETELYIKGASEAFKYMDPVTLASTSRDKISAQLPILGRQWTETLLNRKDSLEKKSPEDVKIDHDDMMSVMQEMGLKPFEKNKNEAGKAAIATTQSRIERALTEATAGGVKLNREQKNALIRNEVAKSVTVNGSMFGSWSADTKPIVELTSDELSRIQIPPDEFKPAVLPNGKQRAGIQDEMAELYKLSGGKATQYEPTQENLARFYLQYRKGSATSKFIPKAP